MTILLVAFALILVVGGYLYFDLTAARIFFEESPDLSAENVSFARWWLRQNVIIIAVLTLSLIILLLVAITPESSTLLRRINISIEHLELILLFLGPTVYIAFDLKVARSFYCNDPILSDEEIPFYRWWLRVNAAKLAAGGGVIALLLFITHHSYAPTLLRSLPVTFSRPLLAATLMFGVISFGFWYDLSVARAYFRNSPVLSAEEVPFLRWWLSVNRFKLGSMVLLCILGVSGFIFRDRLLLPQFSTETSGFIASADRYFKEQKYYEAALELRNAISKNPEDADAHLWLGRSLVKQGMPREALQEYQTLLNLDPENYSAHLELAHLALVLGDVPLSYRMVKRASELRPEEPAPHLLLAEMAARSGNAAEALAQSRIVLKSDPTNPEARNLLFNTFMRSRSFTETVTEAETNLRQDPDDTDMRIVLALAFERLGKWRDAETALQEAAARAPGNPAPHVALGDLRSQRGEHHKAEQSYEEALKRSPDNVIVMNNIASLLADQNYNLGRAYQLASSLYNRFPDDANLADTLGWVLCRMGRLEQAVPLLRQAVSRMPGNPVFRYHFGVALVNKGNLPAGRRQLETALQQAKEFNGADQARSMLRTTAGNQKR